MPQCTPAGCTAVVNYSTEDFVERTFELTGGLGVKAVYDSVGKDTFRGSLASSAFALFASTLPHVAKMKAAAAVKPKCTILAIIAASKLVVN